MRSAFPGMDPYLEKRSRWQGVHLQLLAEMRRLITSELPPGYVTDVEERLVVDEGNYRADLSVRDTGAFPGEGGVATETVVTAAPVVVSLPEEVPERWLEVLTEDGRLVTTIELLSWSNKRPGKGRDHFLERREQLLAGETHYVEVDLLRGGRPMPSCGEPEAHYRVLVSDAGERPKAGFWPISLRDSLPQIPIPLRAPDRQVSLDLQAAVDAVVDVGRFAPRIYKHEPEPVLESKDAAWAAERLQEVGVGAA